MKKSLFAVIVLFLLGINLFAQGNESKKYDSIWEGKINISDTTSLRVVLKIIKNNDGSLKGFLDSPDQGAKDIPASSISLTEDSLKFEIKMLAASYNAKILKDSMVADGKFKQGMSDLQLILKKVDDLVINKRPQTPTKPYPYNEEEVAFENKTANISLAGTLTLPKVGRKFPVVVLVTGSGKQDRNETVFDHKPFLVIADYLTRNGIAVLRYDDRGAGKSTGNYSAATTGDLATDAEAAIAYLKTRSEIDQNKIGIIGHSEGGIIGPMVAANSDDVKFVVMLAGPGMPGKDLIPLQTKLLMKAAGNSDEVIQKVVDDQKEAFNIIVTEPDSAAVVKKMEELFNNKLAGMSNEEKEKPENSKAVFEAKIREFTKTWFRYFIKYDPVPALENVRVPVLALFGSKDLQVPSIENLPLVEEALKAAGNKNYKVMELPGLNHLFQTAKTGSALEYGQIEETFSPTALKVIGDWIKEVTSKM